jgi:hypothetical protein
MDFTIQTPTLLFSAISLLMLAYTNRFVVIAALIRELYAKYQEKLREAHSTSQSFADKINIK